MGFNGIYDGIPGLVNIQKVVDFPINSMVDLSIVFCMFTKG